MGDRVYFQCWIPDDETGNDQYGPAIYGHNSGSLVPEILNRLRTQMATRPGDIPYATARLVECLINETGIAGGCYSVGVENADRLYHAGDSPGDAGVVRVNVLNFSAEYLGGYYGPDGKVLDVDETPDPEPVPEVPAPAPDKGRLVGTIWMQHKPRAHWREYGKLYGESYADLRHQFLALTARERERWPNSKARYQLRGICER